MKNPSHEGPQAEEADLPSPPKPFHHGGWVYKLKLVYFPRKIFPLNSRITLFLTHSILAPLVFFIKFAPNNETSHIYCRYRGASVISQL